MYLYVGDQTDLLLLVGLTYILLRHNFFAVVIFLPIASTIRMFRAQRLFIIYVPPPQYVTVPDKINAKVWHS